MTEITRRHLFALGAAAAVAPVLPAVSVAAPAPGTTLTLMLSNYSALLALMNRLLDSQVEHLTRQIEGEIMRHGTRVLRVSDDGAEFIPLETFYAR